MSETAADRGPHIPDADGHDTASAGWAVAALYRFSALPDFADRRAPLQELCETLGVTGTLLLASEGINGTIAGRRAALDGVVATLRGWPGFAELDVKWSAATDNPFLRMKVRLKREIVTMGVPDIDPTRTVGTYVEPDAWNELIARDDVVLVDTRNDYEVAIGTFDGAIDPKTTSFREFPDWVDANLDPRQNTAVAMFCTGGIRCEKATALLKERGFDRVYHLKGGILKYLETVPSEESRWQGECFVFDRRVSVGHGLTEGHYQLCSVCRRPIAAADGRGGGFAAQDCPECRAGAQPETLARADERRRQIRLARQRGSTHLGRKRGS